MHPDEQEMTINLRPLIEVPVRWWRIILVFVILFMLFGLLQTTNIYKAPTYSAEAGVAIIQSRTRVQLDTTAKTLSEDELNQEGIKATSSNDNRDEATIRLITLVNLVQNASIEDIVRTRLKDELTEEELEPGQLVSKIEGRVVEIDKESGDLVQIVATHEDPVMATRIANIWAEEYEKLVNDLYARPPQITETMRDDLKNARSDYDQKQKQLIELLTVADTYQLENQINAKKGLVEFLHSKRQQVIDQVISLETDSNSKFLTAYLEALANNRLLFFQDEQNKKHQLLSAYLNTQNKAILSLFNNEAQERQRKFDDTYALKVSNEQHLLQARALFEQAQAGGDAASTGLALAFLKMKIAGAYPPEGFQLMLSDGVNITPNDVVNDTRALVAALENQKQDIQTIIGEQQQLLVDGEGLFMDTPLTDTLLIQKTMELYPKLFDSGEFSLLEQSIGDNTWLEQQIRLTAEQMINLNFDKNVTDYMTTDTPLNKLINSLEEDVLELEAQLMQENDRKAMLTQERDIAFNTYTTLLQKVAEFELANQLPSTEVRFAALASVPTEPSDTRTRTVNLIGFFFFGAFLGLLGTVWMEYFGNTMQPKGAILKWVATPQAIPESYTTRNQAP